MTDAHKEIHNHYQNGSSKLVWAWAGTSTFVVIAFLGLMVRAQWTTNESLRETNQQLQTAIGQLSVRVSRLEERIENLQRTIEQRE